MAESASETREASWKFVAEHGLARNEHLPMLSNLKLEVSAPLVGARLLCMHATAAASFGFSSQQALAWLQEEGLYSDLSTSERLFLEGDTTKIFIAQTQIQSMYALAWCSGLVSEERLMRELPDDFVLKFPDLRFRPPTKDFLDRIDLREIDQIIPYLDRSYCLHWAMRDAQLGLKKNPGLRWLPAVEAQRHALEWVVKGGDWENVPLDT